MQKQRCVAIVLMIGILLLSGCVSEIWTGANLVYDRHNVYIKLNDFKLNANANRGLYQDNVFKADGVAIEIAVFNRDILLVGYVPTEALREEAYSRVNAMTEGRRRLFNQIGVGVAAEDNVQDAWITAKIRSQILADASINPGAFKVITSGHIVYLMGDVIPDQADKVIVFARQCAGVKRVVKLFRYYNLSDKPI